MKKSVGKFLLITMVVFFFIVVSGVTVAWILFPPQKIKAMIIPEVEKALGRKVQVDKAGLSIYPVFGVSVSGVQISNTNRQGFSDEPFVKLDRFLIQIGCASIFKGHPEIAKIIIKKPQVLLEIDQKGAFNYDDMAIFKGDTTVKKEKKSSGMLKLPVPISLRSFVIEDGSIVYDDKRGKQKVIIGDIDEQIGFSIDKELKDIKTDGDLILSQISVKTEEITKPLTNLKFTLHHSINADLVNGNATINELRLSLQKIFLNLTGTVKNLNSEPDLDIVVKSDPIEIKSLLAEIPVELAPDVAKMTASGNAEIGLVIKGVLRDSSALPVAGSIKLKDVMLKYVSLPKSINNLNADANFNDSSVYINSMKLNFGDNPVELRASCVNFKNPFVDLAILAKLNLDDMKDIIALPKGASVGGHANIDVNAKGVVDPSDPSKLDVKGTVDLTKLSVLWPPLVKPALIDGRFTLSSKAIGPDISVQIGQSSLKLDAAVTNYLSFVFADSTKKLPRPSAEFKLTSSFLNVDEFFPPSKDTAKTAAKAEANDVPLIAPLPGVDMKGLITAKKIIYEGIEMDNLNLRMSVIKDIADLDIKTGIASGTLNNVIHADLQNTQDIKFNNKLTVENVEVRDLMKRFGGFVKPTNALNKELINIQNSLSGKVYITSAMTGHGGTADELTKSLNGDMTAKIGSGKITNSIILNRLSGVVEKFVKLEDLEFRNLKAIMKIENEKVHFNSFQIGSFLGDWDILGTVGFDASIGMDISSKLTKETSAKLLEVQNSGKTIAKNLLSGTKLAGIATSLVDNVGVPSDKDGRVTLKMFLGGTTSDPKASFKGFGAGDTKNENQPAQQSVKQQITREMQQTVSEKKEELDQKLQQEKAAAEQELKKKIEEEKAALQAQPKEEIQQLKKDATNKLKKFLK